MRNKPSSLSYWLHGFAIDSQDLPEEDDIIVSIGKGKPLVDEGVKPRPFSLQHSKPYMLFLTDINVNAIQRGHGVASRYSLGRGWIDGWAKQFCDGKCETIDNEASLSFGAVSQWPIVLSIPSPNTILNPCAYILYSLTF